jgi:hypothetical protein
VTNRSLQAEIEIVSEGLASAKNAIGRIMAKSDSHVFRKGYDLIDAIYKNVDISASVLTPPTRTQTFRR